MTVKIENNEREREKVTLHQLAITNQTMPERKHNINLNTLYIGIIDNL